MPGRDGTGPMGRGCGTGRAMGRGRGRICGSNQFAGKGLGLGIANRGNFDNVDASSNSIELIEENEKLKNELDALRKEKQEK